MSMTMADAAYEAHAAAEALDELRAEAIADFQQERLRSYYEEHPEVTQQAIHTLKEAQALFEAKFISASLVFAFSATEQGLRNILLRPILSGLMHNELAARLIAPLYFPLDRLPKFLFPIVAEIANLDLSTYCRKDQPTTLWNEFGNLRVIRNAIVHHGERAKPDDACAALAVGHAMLSDVCARVMSAVAPSE